MEYQEYLQAVQDQMTANNQWSALQAQKQMDFQKEMSDTAHQREVADLKAAGLNPVLSAHGTGASTPNGAMASNNGDLNAYAGFLATILDTENANARANLMAASRGSSSTSAFGNANFLTNLLMALGMNRSQAQGVGNTVESLGGVDNIVKSTLAALGIDNNGAPKNNSNVTYEVKNTSSGTSSGSSNGVNWKTSSASKNTYKIGDQLKQVGKNILEAISTPFRKK